MKICAIIPTFENAATIERVVRDVRTHLDHVIVGPGQVLRQAHGRSDGLGLWQNPVERCDLRSADFFDAEKFPVPADQVKAAGLESITNLIVRRRYGQGRTVALNAHGDVVPPGEGWTYPPYGGEVHDGKLYGRASAVSKCDFATFIFAMVPVIGPTLIWGGAAVWLYDQGQTGWAIFMLLWGMLGISSVDNFIKPVLISRTAAQPLLLIVVGVFGGVLVFGFIGLFLGPTLLALGQALIREWMADKASDLPPSEML